MTKQDKKIADLELQIEFYKNEINKCNKVNIELSEQLRIGGVSQQRELLLAYEKSQYETTWWMSETEVTNRINNFLANNCG